MNINQIEYTGRAYKYKPKHGLHPSAWKECWLVLYNNGELRWYNDKQCTRMVNRKINVKSNTSSITIGQYNQGSTSKATNSNNNLPQPLFGDYSLNRLMSIRGSERVEGKKNGNKGRIDWFYFKSDKDLAKWIGAFAQIIGRKYGYDEVMERERRSSSVSLVRPASFDNSEISGDGQSSSDGGNGTNANRGALTASRVQTDYGAVWQKIVSMKPDDERLITNRRQQQQTRTTDNHVDEPEVDGTGWMRGDESREQDSPPPQYNIVVHKQSDNEKKATVATTDLSKPMWMPQSAAVEDATTMESGRKFISAPVDENSEAQKVNGWYGNKSAGAAIQSHTAATSQTAYDNKTFINGE